MKKICLNLLFVLFVGTLTVAAQTAEDGFDPNADNAVFAMVVQPDGKIALGGSFTSVGGQPYRFLARVNSDGTIDSSFTPPSPDSGVQKMVLQPDGKILIGGSFDSLSGQPYDGIARLNQNGTVDTSFVPPTSFGRFAFPNDIGLQADGKILVGGQVSPENSSTPPSFLKRLNSDGSVDTTFAETNPNNYVTAFLIQPDGKILVGGSFTSIGAAPRNYIARLNSDGTLDAAFNPNANNLVYALQFQPDGKILVAGRFSQIAGASKNLLARLNPDGTIDQSLTPAASLSGTGVGSMALQPDGKILLGGFYGESGGGITAPLGRSGLIRLLPEGSLDPLFAVQALVRTIVLQPDRKILVGGTTTVRAIFSSQGTQTRNGLARLHPDGTLDSNPIPNPNAATYAVAVQPDGRAIIGGDFTIVHTQTRNRIARLRADGFPETNFNPNADGTVRAVAIQANDQILVGGAFTSIASQPRNRIARLGSNGAIDAGFNPNADNTVRAFAVQTDGKILVGGDFANIGGSTRANLARLNSDGTLDQTFDAQANGIVRSIAVQANGQIVIGGDFTQIGGAPRNFIARLDASGVADSSFNPNASQSVLTLTLQPDGKVLAGGNFTVIGGAPRSFIARLNVDGTADAFAPNADAAVETLGVQADGKILAGGNFNSIGAAARSRFARLNAADGTNDAGFTANFNAAVLGTALASDGAIHVVGSFSAVNGSTRNFISRLRNIGAAPAPTLTVSADSAVFSASGTAPEFHRVRFERSADGVNYTLLGEAMRAGGVWGIGNLNLPAGQYFHVRARGFYSTGNQNGSGSISETVRAVYFEPTAAAVSISGRILAANGRGVARAVVYLTDSSGNNRKVTTNSFGYYRFQEIEAGQTFVVSVFHKKYQFAAQVLVINEDLQNLNFTASAAN